LSQILRQAADEEARADQEAEGIIEELVAENQNLRAILDLRELSVPTQEEVEKALAEEEEKVAPARAGDSAFFGENLTEEE